MSNIFYGGGTLDSYLQRAGGTMTGALIMESANQELVAGTLLAGTAAGAADVNFYRNAANEWRTDDSISVAGTVTAETELRGSANANVLGTLQFGTAFGAEDSNIYRQGANQLKTDDSFTIAGTPSFPGLPGTVGLTENGDMGFDAAGSVLYMRQSGTIFAFNAGSAVAV